MFPPFNTRIHARVFAAAAVFGLSLAQAGPLDGLEMDVLDAHETPVRATSRIVLPQMLDDERDYGAKRAAVVEPRGPALLERSIEVAAPAEPEPAVVAAQKPAPEPELGSTVSAAEVRSEESETSSDARGGEGAESPSAAETPELDKTPAEGPAAEPPAPTKGGT